jgi:hypothetical protein
MCYIVNQIDGSTHFEYVTNMWCARYQTGSIASSLSNLLLAWQLGPGSCGMLYVLLGRARLQVHVNMVRVNTLSPLTTSATFYLKAAWG